MKVLFVSSSRKGKGISPFIKSQAESLLKNGISLEFYQIEGSGIINYIKSIPKINRKLKDGSFDLIHAHYNLCGIASKFACFGKNAKLIVSFMGDDLYGTYDRNSKLTLKGKLNILLTKWFTPFYNGIIVKSNRMLGFINTRYHAKVRVVPNGVDFDQFKPVEKTLARKELGIRGDKKFVLFLNNPADPRKNYALFKEALKYVNNDFEELTPYPVPHDKVALYLNACDIFVQVSKLEGSSNLVKEAIACNSRIVVTDVGDANELLKEVKCAYITTFNAREIGNKIDVLLTNHCLSNSREINSGLEINLIARKIIDFYKSTLKSE